MREPANLAGGRREPRGRRTQELACASSEQAARAVRAFSCSLQISSAVLKSRASLSRRHGTVVRSRAGVAGQRLR